MDRRRQLSLSHDDLSDHGKFVYFKVSKQTCSLLDLAVENGSKLPLVISIEDIQFSQTNWSRIASNEVLFLSHLEQRRRVLCRAEDGSQYSIPLDYPVHFILYKRSSILQSQQPKKKHSGEPIYYEMDSCRMLLDDIVAQNKLPCCVAVDNTDLTFYSVTAEGSCPVSFGRMTLTHVYYEKYFVGCEIRNGKLSQAITLLPSFLRIKVRFVQGFSQKKDKKKSWKTFVAECTSEAATIIGNSVKPPDDITQLRSTDVTKVTKTPNKLDTVEPIASIKFTSIHIDNTYEELPLVSTATTSPVESFVSTFRTAKKFNPPLGHSKDVDSDSEPFYEEAKTSSDVVRPNNLGTSHPVMPLSDYNLAKIPFEHHHSTLQSSKKSPFPDLRPAPSTLPKKFPISEEQSRPRTATPYESSAKFGGLQSTNKSPHGASISFQTTRDSVGQDSGYSTAPEFPFTTVISQDLSSGYSSISQTDAPLVPDKRPGLFTSSSPHGNAPITMQPIPRFGQKQKMVEVPEISSFPNRKTGIKPYELRSVPPPPCLNQSSGNPLSESKSSLRGSTDHLFDPVPRSPIDRIVNPPFQSQESTRSVQRPSQLNDLVVPAPPQLKLTQSQSDGSSGPEILGIKSMDSKLRWADSEKSDNPLGQIHEPRSKQKPVPTKSIAKPRKPSPEEAKKSASFEKASPTVVPKGNASPASNSTSLSLSNFRSSTDKAVKLPTPITSPGFRTPPPPVSNLEESTSPENYESANRNSRLSNCEYEVFLPKSPEQINVSKPKLVPLPPLKIPPPISGKPNAKPDLGSAIESISDIPDDLERLSCSQLTDCLRLLKMEQYIATFLENQIDGKLLLELDESILTTDLKVSGLHARKLLVFAHQGWRP